MKRKLLSALTILALLVASAVNVSAQTLMPLPSWSYNYSGSVRGYWFQAPVDFTIKGLRVASEAGSGTQRIQVIKINDNNPSGSSSNLTTLYYTNNGANGVIQQVNIQISAGDWLAIMGYAGTTNPYGLPSGTYNLAGHGVTLKRATAGSITSSPTSSIGLSGVSYISRVEMYYETCDADIDSDPQTKSICEDANTDFNMSATLSGGSGSYRWQVDEGTGFIDVTNSNVFSGATTNKLQISNTPYGLDGYEFRCIAEVGTCADTTASATLTVNGLVKIDDLQSKDTTCIDATKSLQVDGTGSITNYRWQIYNSVNGKFEDVPTAPPYVLQGNTLNINGVPDTLDGARFRVVVDGVCDNVISSPTTLVVNKLPKVVVPPVDVNAMQGESIMFEVQATGRAVYHWQVAAPDTFVNINDGGIYSGSRTNRLHVSGVSRVQDNFKFRCVVETDGSCIAPGDTSNFAILYVEPPASVSSLSGDINMDVYPNPANDVLYLHAKNKINDELQYVIIDKIGRTVLSGDVNSGNKTSIDVNNLIPGMYMIKIFNQDAHVHMNMKFTKF